MLDPKTSKLYVIPFARSSSVFVVSQWAAFYVNDDEMFHGGEWCYEVGIANAFPLITLTRREATELVYVTALCRGVVKTLKEFNEKYVGKGPAFIVRLSNPKCETDFGRMLYDAVADGVASGGEKAKTK